MIKRHSTIFAYGIQNIFTEYAEKGSVNSINIEKTDTKFV